MATFGCELKLVASPPNCAGQTWATNMEKKCYVCAACFAVMVYTSAIIILFFFFFFGKDIYILSKSYCCILLPTVQCQFLIHKKIRLHHQNHDMISEKSAERRRKGLHSVCSWNVVKELSVESRWKKFVFSVIIFSTLLVVMDRCGERDAVSETVRTKTRTTM